MSISNEQIEAATGAMVRQQPALASGFDADALEALARAALEAGEAAKKEEARPAAETREWWPDEAFAHHYGPTLPTEGDK